MRSRLIVLLAVLCVLLPAGGASAAPTIRHGIVPSFDGTPIAYTFMHPGDGRDVPVVLMGHGWGQRRTRDASGIAGTLLGAGYAMLTWDSRGFGDSGGEAQADSQDYEVRDVQALIDLAAAEPGVALDGPGDPRMGMVGASYGGGIQLMTASADQRVDAIVPQIAWNDLPEALKPGGVLKLAWDLALYSSGFATAVAEGLDSPAGTQTGAYAAEIHQSFVEGTAYNDWSPEIAAWFDARSAKHYINGHAGRGLAGIHAPTLLIEGASDTIFPINQAIDNWRQIRANGVEASMIFFCGKLISANASHGLAGVSSCADSRSLAPEIVAWFNTHLRGADGTFPAIRYQTQGGGDAFASIDALPATAVAGSGAGALVNTVAPTTASQFGGNPPAAGAITVPITGTGGRTLVGVPHVRATVTPIAGSEAYLFFRLMDGTTVIDEQVTALKVTGLDAGPQTIERDLNGIVWDAQGDLRLEITATSADHASSRTPFAVQVDVTEVSVPVL